MRKQIKKKVRQGIIVSLCAGKKNLAIDERKQTQMVNLFEKSQRKGHRNNLACKLFLKKHKHCRAMGDWLSSAVIARANKNKKRLQMRRLLFWLLRRLALLKIFLFIYLKEDKKI